MEYPRGISSCRRLRNLVRKNSIPFVVLLEPRASVNNLDSLKSFLGFNDFIASPNKINLDPLAFGLSCYVLKFF